MAVRNIKEGKRPNVFTDIVRTHGNRLSFKPKPVKGEKKENNVSFRLTDSIAKPYRVLYEKYSDYYSEKSDFLRTVFEIGINLMLAYDRENEKLVNDDEFDLVLELDDIRKRDAYFKEMLEVERTYKEGISKGFATIEEMERTIKRGLMRAPDKRTKKVVFDKIATMPMRLEQEEDNED